MAERFEWAYRLRGVLMAPPFLAIVFVYLGETERDMVIWPLGLTVFALGALIRIWAQMHLHYRLRMRKTLATTGPYALVRNPIYIANTAILLALTVVSELLWFLPVTLLWCVAVYGFVVRREEAHLQRKYGAPYVEYLRRVPRWMPELRRQEGRPATAIHTFWPSIVAELHCLLYLIPLLGKELVSAID